MEVLATASLHLGEVVAMPREPRKNESEVVVEMREPTVNCEVVAIKVVPAELDVMIEFPAKEVALVPPLETESVPVMVERVVVETQPIVPFD